jgi:predicted PurR-regulated permease PerM
MLGIDLRTARYAWTVALVVLLLCLLYLLRRTLFVFIIALLFAYLLSPLVNIINRFLPGQRTRTTALAIAYVIFVAVLFIAVSQIGSRAIVQANSFVQTLPALLAKWQQPPAAGAPASFKAQLIQKAQEQIGKSSGEMLAALPRAGARLLSIASDLVYVVIVPILGFFFLKDGSDLRQHFLGMIEDSHWRALADDLLADINLLLAHYMRAILLLSVATFTAYSIFFTILGIPYSFMLGALASLLEFIPMIGPFAAAAAIVVVTAVSGGSVLAVLVFLAVYRVFQDYVLSPNLMGRGVQLHPLIVLFGVFAGAEIAGIAGAFLSVPVMALVRVFYRRIRRSRSAPVAVTES